MNKKNKIIVDLLETCGVLRYQSLDLPKVAVDQVGLSVCGSAEKIITEVDNLLTNLEKIETEFSTTLYKKVAMVRADAQALKLCCDPCLLGICHGLRPYRNTIALIRKIDELMGYMEKLDAGLVAESHGDRD